MRDLYEAPATAFVANFLGAANLIPIGSRAHDGGAALTLGRFSLRSEAASPPDGEAVAMIRPEYVRLEPQGVTGENRLPGMVEEVVYLGFHQHVSIRLATGALVRADVPNDGEAPEYEQGDAVTVHLRAQNLRVLAADADAPVSEPGRVGTVPAAPEPEPAP